MIIDSISKNILDAKKHNMTINTLLLGKYELEQLQNELTDICQYEGDSSITTSSYFMLDIINVDMDSYIGVANVSSRSDITQD